MNLDLEKMIAAEKEQTRQETLLKWIARLGGLLISAAWIFSLVSSTVQDSILGRYQWSLEGGLLIVLIASSVIGVGVGWKDRVSGGKITVVASLFLTIFSYFSAGQNRLFAVALSGLPFFLVGMAYLQSGAGLTSKH